MIFAHNKVKLTEKQKNSFVLIIFKCEKYDTNIARFLDEL